MTPAGPTPDPTEASGGQRDAERPSEAFPRQRRLKRRRLIRPLFDRRRRDVHSLAVGVVRLKWRLVPHEATGQSGALQVGFAPGRRARTNAGRTTLRRHLRETFRRHQGGLIAAMDAHPGQTLTLMLLFRGREETASADLSRDLPRALDRLARRLAPEASGDAAADDRTPDASAP
ncbi:MAG: ribonuclease P protein component [Bacteroidota bacterium]